MSRKKQKYQGIVYSTDPDFDYANDEARESETLAPEKQSLRIELDRKLKGGKKLTRIYNFEGNEADLKELGKILKNKCGCGGSVKEGQVLLQGDFRNKVRDVLDQMGYRYKMVGG